MKNQFKNISPLYKARTKLGLTLDDVAKGIGLTISAIHQYEKFDRYPSAKCAWLLIEFYASHGIKITLMDCYPRYRFIEKTS